MSTVFKREFKSYFDNMLGYVFVAFILFFFGITFAYINLYSGWPYFSTVITSGFTMIILIVAIPLLTMKSLAEERKSKTDQILFTSPVSITKIILGKYFAMVAVFAIPVIISCLFPLVIAIVGVPSLLVDYSTILAFFLMGCAYIAIGLFISSLTESQILAALGTFGVLLMLYFMSSLTSFLGTAAITSAIAFLVLVLLVALVYFLMTKNKFVSYIIAAVGIIAILLLYIFKSSIFVNALPSFLSGLSLTKYLSDFSYELFDVTGLIYFISIGFLFVFLTVQSIQKRRYS